MVETALQNRSTDATSTASTTQQLPPVPPVHGWRDFPAYTLPTTFKYCDIREYFLNTPRFVTSVVNDSSDTDTSTTDDFGVTKPLRRDRQYFLSGHVKNIQHCDTGDFHFIKSIVMSSLKLDVVYHVYVTVNRSNGSVVGGSCECKASAMGRCSHVCAVLLAIDDYIIEFGYEPTSCTSKLCTWNQGRKTQKNPGIAHTKQYVKEKAKKRAFDASIIEHDSCPKNETPSAARSFNNNFTATLTNTGNTSMWSTILQIQYEDYILTDDDVKVLHYKCQQFYTNVCDAVPDPIPCHLVNTLGQAHNETWHQQRWFRLTASSCKEAVTCKTNKSLTEYLKKTLWGLGKTQTAAMAYGI